MKNLHPCLFIVLIGWSTLIAEAARAHPHMFVEARAEMIVDDERRLIALRIVMRVDELTTLFVLEENKVEKLDAPLTSEQSATIGAGFVDGLGYYRHFTDLRIGDERQAFSGAEAVDVRLEGFQLAATLELTLETPQGIDGKSVELALYDPTYYAAVETLEPPKLPPDLTGCRSRLLKFQPTSLDSATLTKLSALSREETPDDPEVGAQFSDRSFVTCSD